METITIKDSVYKAPYANLLRRLTEGEYSDLKKDIASRGIIVPIVLDESGNILDGYHRLKIASELGLNDFLSEIKPGLSDEEKEALARDLNEHRRHLTKKERAALILKRTEQGWSNGKIADEVEIGRETVRRSTAPFGAVDRVESKDGKNRPAQKPTPEEIAERRVKVRELKSQGWTNAKIAKHLGISKGTVANDLKPPKQTTIITKNRKEETTARKTFETTLPEDLPDTVMDVKRLGRVSREVKNKHKRANGTNTETIYEDSEISYTIYPGDFRTELADLESDSVDLIFTDPPYGQDYLPLWQDLAELAAKVLKPGGLLITYSGQYHLPTIMGYLSNHLEYVWLGSLKMCGGAKNEVQQKKVYSRAKPLLFYSKGAYEPSAWFDDFFDDDKPEKEDHEWQQGIAPALYYIERLTQPGGVVIDPFLGSGTTGKAAIQLKRKFIGCEIDAAHYQTATARLEEIKNGSKGG